MRNPIEVLKHLSEKSQDTEYRFQRLYRNMYNPEFYYLAYRNIHGTAGSMTKGVDGSNMDGMSQRRIDKIIASLQDQSYQPLPARRVYIEKKNSTKKRPLGIQAGNDKLVEEIIRMMLESIYEPTFSKSSHGFRQRRSCHTALAEIKKTFTGSTWFVEGDITACFDSFDHHVLVNLLGQRIDDEKFIALMWKFLKAGYMELWEYHTTYSGTPQGSGMSPMLANIYLGELDKFMAQRQAEYQVGARGDYRYTREYTHLSNRNRGFFSKNAKVWDTLSKGEKKALAKQYRAMKTEMLRTPAFPTHDERRKSMHYVRYADDFIIGVTGSKAEALKLKEDLGAFLKDKLRLTLSQTKTKITHTSERARFLGYDIIVRHTQEVKTIKGEKRHGHRMRAFNGKVSLLMPYEKWAGKLLEYKAIRIKQTAGGKDRMVAAERTELLNRTDIEILLKYNAETRGLYNYYSIASNASSLWGFAGLMKYSMLKSFANKYRVSCKEIKKRYTKNGAFTVKYQTKKGAKSIEFIHSFKRKEAEVLADVDETPTYHRYERTNTVAARLKAGKCELCGKEGSELEMHQVKRLKDMRGFSQWELKMLNKRRKTLAVCRGCHSKIHA